MASNPSPSCSDDFVMLESHQVHDLPLRQRFSGDQAGQYHDFETSSSDDDLEHISRPDSVRSLNTPSPSSSPLLVPTADADADANNTIVSSLPSPTSNTLPQHSRDSVVHHQAESDLPTHDVSNLQYSPQVCFPRTQPLPSPKCHSHASLDQDIMDHLVEHALTARIEQEHGHGSSKDKDLRQQMMTRFRSLPATHPFVKQSMSQLDGSKALFQGQKRSSMQLKLIYRHVFTYPERMALNFLFESHARHFDGVCDLYSSLVQPSRAQRCRDILQPGAEPGRLLAREVHTRVIHSQRFHSFEGVFDNLRKETRLRLNSDAKSEPHFVTGCPFVPGKNDETSSQYEPRAFVTSDPGYQQYALDRIFDTTITELPNNKLSLDDPHGSRSMSTSRVAKREPPEDDVEPDSVRLSPPLKKFQPDARGRQVMSSEIFSVFKLSMNDPLPARDSMYAKSCNPQSTLSQPMSSESVTQHPSNGNIDTGNNHPLQDFQIQHEILSRQCAERYAQARLEARKIHSAQPKVERLDENSQMPAPMQLATQMARYRKNQRLMMAHNDHLIAQSDHFAAPSRNAVAIAEGPAREYRQDTLLARSTQLPFPSPTGLSDGRLSSGELESPRMHNKSVQPGVGKRYSFAPARQPEESSKTINDWKAQMIHVEECREWIRQTVKNPDNYQLLVNANKEDVEKIKKIQEDAENFKPDPKPLPAAQPAPNPPIDCQESLSTGPSQQPAKKLAVRTRKPNPDYEMQLMLLEEQNRVRLMQRREDEQRRHSKGDGDNKCPSRDQSGHDHSVSTSACETKSTHIVDFNKQLALFEEEIDRRLMHYRQVYQQLQSDGSTVNAPVPDNQKAQEQPTLSGKWGLGAVSLADYQRKLMDSERQRCLKVDLGREESETQELPALSLEARPGQRASHRASQYPGPKAAHRDNDRVSWTCFDYTRDGVLLEYTIRTDIESVDTDTLTWFFKDVNCLHESCEGWQSTAERTRQAEIAYLGRNLEEQTDLTDLTSLTSLIGKQVNNSADLSREKLAENKMAWSLAKLNPCLRADEAARKEQLLGTAVKHLMSLRHCPTVRGTESHKGRFANMSNAHGGTSKNAFIIENADDIMNDAHLEEDSSSSEDGDDGMCLTTLRREDASKRGVCPVEEPAPDSEFPFGSIDDEGTRYLTFQYDTLLSSGNEFSIRYYTVRADTDSVKHSGRPFPRDGWSSAIDQCICLPVWKQQQARTLIHYKDCEVALALSKINPILEGEEAGLIRCAAMLNHRYMEMFQKWPPNTGDRFARLRGLGLNPVVMQKDVEDGYVLFMHAPNTSVPSAQCRYCNMIVDGAGLRDRVTHLSSCDGFFRKGEIRLGT